VTVPARLGGPALALRDRVLLLAPGGAFLPDTRALVIADTHAGLPMELRARGHAVPVGDDRDLHERVRAMLSLVDAHEIIVAGDFTHGPGSQRAPRAGASAVTAFVRAFSSHTVRIVRGNHDRALAPALDALGVEHALSLRAGPHEITHGDELEPTLALREAAHARGGRVIVGHVHPALVLDDGEGARRTCPAFVTARGLLCLPALSPWARGGDVRARSVRAQLEALSNGDPMGVAVVVGADVLPVGDVFPRAKR
jgi:putative SbcD/Mre11-related phosphoesterase